MADTKAFYKLLFQLRDLENTHDLNLWYVELAKPSPYGQKGVWDAMSDKDKKLLIKNINDHRKILEKMEKTKLSRKDMTFLASVENTATMKKFRIYYSPPPFPEREKPEVHYLGYLKADNFDMFMKELDKLIYREKNLDRRPGSGRRNWLDKVIDIYDTSWGVTYGLHYLEERQDDIFK
jgi:hypothetical protein